MKDRKLTEMNTIELYATWFLDELKDAGYIINYYREPETMIVAEKTPCGFLQKFKRKDDEVRFFNLFQEFNYTYDYAIIWDPSARYIFFDVLDDFELDGQKCFQYGRPPFIANFQATKNGAVMPVTRIDVKPTNSVSNFGKTSSSITFIYKQKMIYDKLGIYIEKFIPIPMAGSGKTSSRFPNMFTPKRYLLTDAGRQQRKIKYPLTSLDGYVHKRMKLIS